MSQGNSNSKAKNGHLFTVEILIEEATNGLAMEKLLHLLNADTVKDYKILKGIDLGKLIALNTSAAKPAAVQPVAKTAPPAVKPSNADAAQDIMHQLETFKTNNTLIRLTVIKAQGIKLNLPCRILNFDRDNQNVTVYHVDEKKVYLFKLNEIDDYLAFDPK